MVINFHCWRIILRILARFIASFHQHLGHSLENIDHNTAVIRYEQRFQFPHLTAMLRPPMEFSVVVPNSS